MGCEGAQGGMGQLNVLLFGLAFQRCHRQSASEDRGDNDNLKSCKTDVMLIVIKRGYIKLGFFFFFFHAGYSCENC